MFMLVLLQILQMVFFGLAAVSDLQVGKKKAPKILNRCKDLLFSVFVFPVGTVRVLYIYNAKQCVGASC